MRGKRTLIRMQQHKNMHSLLDTMRECMTCSGLDMKYIWSPASLIFSKYGLSGMIKSDKIILSFN